MLIIIVGCGGTGTIVASNLGHLLHKESDRIVLIDGDMVEEKNVNRQLFGQSDVGRSKAEVLCEAMEGLGGYLNIQFIPRYLISEQEILKLTKNENDVIIIGCVDNHRARQVMHRAFYRLDKCIYIDSANEYSEGEIVVGVRKDGEDIAPPRGYWYKDVLTDASPRADELGCGVVNQSNPQHYFTNLLQGFMIAKVVAEYRTCGRFEGGKIFCFPFSDPYEIATKFRPWPLGEPCPTELEVMPSEDEVFG